MLTVAEAQDSLLARLSPLPRERIPLLQSLGRVLAEELLADIDNPAFDNSAVDGFAVRAADTRDASPRSPVALTMLEEVMAGSVPLNAVAPGACIKVMTGAPMPAGADSMVMVEDTTVAGTRVSVTCPSSVGDHIRRAGEDIRAGNCVLPAGAVVRSAEAAILAAMGKPEVDVLGRPRVAVVSTGDEVIGIDRKPGPGQIRNSNAYALAALLAEAGAELHSMSHIADSESETEKTLRSCAGLDGGEPADIIVTSGGVSVGERDYVKPALERLGRLEFWRVRMKPGKPVAFGSIGRSLFFGLPGNPVSTMVTFELFVRPAIRKMAGHQDVFRPRVPVTLTREVRRQPGREEYIRGTVWATDQGLHARPAGSQGSGSLSSMVGANALLVMPADLEYVSPGAVLPALLLDVPLSTSPDRETA